MIQATQARPVSSSRYPIHFDTAITHLLLSCSQCLAKQPEGQDRGYAMEGVHGQGLAA